MANLDLNKNSAGSSQRGHIGGLNIGTNLQSNTQHVMANPEVYQHNSIRNNPYVVSDNTNDNRDTKHMRYASKDFHYREDYKKCPYHGHC